MCQDVLQVAKEVKSRSAAYNSIKTSLQSLERKFEWVTALNEGSSISKVTSSHRHVCLSSRTLQNRSLTNVIRKEDLVVSEYLTTLLVFVPRCGTPLLLLHHHFGCLFLWKGWFFFFFCGITCRRSFSLWESTYECLSDLVVPRSSRWILFISLKIPPDHMTLPPATGSEFTATGCVSDEYIEKTLHAVSALPASVLPDHLSQLSPLKSSALPADFLSLHLSNHQIVFSIK